MQPPPRKAKAATILRNLHNEQINKLQAKHQQDSDFLDDIRNFTKIRASIEKEYGQALVKLATTYLQRKVPNYTEFKSSDGEDQRTVYTVWKTLLDETEKIGKARLAAAEVYHQQISESAKTLRVTKLQTAKKCFENIRRMQDELQQCIQELDKTKKLYFEEEHMAHDAREKAQDAEEKLKRKKGRIFQSISSLQKNSTKFSFRREACDIQATKARNDYILALVAANAHQSKFYEVDLPEVLQNIDCDIYEKIQDYLRLMSRTELLTCAACHSSFTIVQEQADSITRQYTIECFLQDNPVLAQTVQYNFDPCDNDSIDKISTEHNAALCLSKEAKKWCTCITKEKRTLKHCWQELAKLQAMLQEKGPIDPQQTQDPALLELENKIDEIKNTIRKAETSKLKAEARIEALREGGVNVDEFVISDADDSLGPYDSGAADTVSRSGTLSSRSSRRSDDHSGDSEPNYEAAPTGGGSSADYDSDYAEEPLPPANEMEETPPPYEYQPPEEDIIAAVQSAWSEAPQEEALFESDLAHTDASIDNDQEYAQGIKCVALFSYQATNPDELSFVEQEELEIISEADEGDGWVKARNYRNEVGFIPQNYVEAIEGPPLVEDDVVEPPLEYSPTPPPPEPDSTLAETPPMVEDEEEPELAMTTQPQEEAEEEYYYALYEYEASCPEELSFSEGAVIWVQDKQVHGVDDGWWCGTLVDSDNPASGIFPSLVVQPLSAASAAAANEEGSPTTTGSPASDSGAPPAFTPPKPQFLVPPAQVILTQPTPLEEEAPEVPDEDEPQPSQPPQPPPAYSLPQILFLFLKMWR